MKNKIIKICYIIILLITIFLTINANSKKISSNEITDLKENTVVIEDGKMLTENDGKLVLITAKPETEAPVKDPKFLLEVENAYEILRSVEIYGTYVDSEGKASDKWFTSTPPKSVTDKNGHTYYNSEPLIENETYYQDVKVGDFLISGENFNLKNQKLIDVEKLPEIDAKTLSDACGIEDNWCIDGKYYSMTSTYLPFEGDMRVRFSIKSLDNINEVTVLAKQNGNNLEAYKLGNKELLGIVEGKKNINEMFDEVTKSQSIIVWIIVIVIELIIGIFVFKDVIKKDKNKTKIGVE